MRLYEEAEEETADKQHSGRVLSAWLYMDCCLHEPQTLIIRKSKSCLFGMGYIMRTEKCLHMGNCQEEQHMKDPVKL